MMAEMDLINRKLSGICGNNSYSSEAPRRFAGYANRLRHVLNQCARSWPPEGTAAAAAPAVMSTAIKGITVDVAKSEETLGVYRRRSRIYIRIHCKQLCAALQERAAAIGAWLALLDSGLASNPDLHQKVADLSRDMEQAQFNLILIEEGVIRVVIHSLTASLEKERECAVKLLLEFSNDKGTCKRIASQKGALVLLSSIAGNLEHPSLSNLAEEVLYKIEKVEENIQHLAAAGRYEPLIRCLCEGTKDVKMEMASLIGNVTLTNSGKEHIAWHGAKELVNMLLTTVEARISSLQALHNLSDLGDNVAILVDLGVLPILETNLFNEDVDEETNLKELAALTIANIVSKSGHWELAFVTKKGRSFLLEFIIHRLLRLLPNASPKCQVAFIQILCGMVYSPQASESVTAHIRSGDGIKAIGQFLGHAETDQRIHAFKLTGLLSARLGQILIDELLASNNLLFLKDVTPRILIGR